jgi:hypothetical protein
MKTSDRLSPEAEVLHAIVRAQLGDLLERPVCSVPEAGKRAYGCRSASSAYDLQRRGGMVGVLRCGDRLVVSTSQLAAHLLGELTTGGERQGAAK